MSKRSPVPLPFVLKNPAGVRSAAPACIDGITTTYFRSEVGGLTLVGDFWGKRGADPDAFSQSASIESLASLVERFATTKYISVVFGQPVDRAALEVFGAVMAYDGGLAATLAVPRAGHSRQAAALLNTYRVDDLDIRDPGLEEVIAQVFGETGTQTTTPVPATKAGR